MSRFLAYLDRIAFLKFPIWDFSLRSFFREYGRLFFFKVLLSHPVRASRGLRRYRRLITEQGDLSQKYYQHLSFPEEDALLAGIRKQSQRALVGLGFCLKPYIPGEARLTCPSGRANHDCLFLEDGQTRQVCSQCFIHKIALKCLEAGCPVYIMTSAKDIAQDLLLPQVKSGTFPASILLLCPYSVRAILLPLLICGIHAFLMAYDRGYCKNYKEWRKADLGDKKEITGLSSSSWDKLLSVFGKIGPAESRYQKFKRQGNIYFPEM